MKHEIALLRCFITKIFALINIRITVPVNHKYLNKRQRRKRETNGVQKIISAADAIPYTDLVTTTRNFTLYAVHRFDRNK